MMKIDLLKDSLKIVVLLRVRKMMNKDLPRKAERELKIAPVVRRNSHLLKERRIRISLLVKMRAYKDVLKILKDQILPISKHHLKMARSLRVLLRANLRVRSLRVLLRVSLLRANLRVRSLRVLLRVSLLRANLRVRSPRVLLRVSLLRANLRVRSLRVLLRVSLLRANLRDRSLRDLLRVSLRVRSLRVLLKRNLFKRNLSLNGKPKNGTVKNGSLKKTERASNGIKMRSVMMISQMKKMRNQDLVVNLSSLMTKMRKTKMTKMRKTKMTKRKMTKKIRNQGLVVALRSLMMKTKKMRNQDLVVVLSRLMTKTKMTKTKMTKKKMTKMMKTKMTKKMRNQDLVVVLSSLSSPSSLNSEFNLKSPLVMSALLLKNLPVKIVLPLMVMKTSLSQDLRDPRMKMATKSSSEFEDLMTASLNNFRYLTDVSIYLG